MCKDTIILVALLNDNVKCYDTMFVYDMKNNVKFYKYIQVRTYWGHL